MQLSYDILDSSQSPIDTIGNIFCEKGKGQLSSWDNIFDETHLQFHRLFILRALGFGLRIFGFCFTKCAGLEVLQLTTLTASVVWGDLGTDTAREDLVSHAQTLSSFSPCWVQSY